MSQPPVTLIYITYNSAEKIPEALRPLEAAYVDGLIHCMVVDNASVDGSADVVRDQFPWVTVMEPGENLGYGKGINFALGSVTTPYVMFMNPDTVMAPAAVSELLVFMERTPKAGMSAPATLRRSGSYQVAGEFPTPGRLMARLLLRREPELFEVKPGDPPRQVDWICGAIMMVRRAMLDDIGVFDPRFFMYFEETDLCRRAKAAGWEIWAIGDAEASHDSNSSARTVDPELGAGGCLDQYFFPSRFYYFSKHDGVAKAIAFELLEPLVLALRDCARWLLRKPGKAELATRLRGPLLKSP